MSLTRAAVIAAVIGVLATPAQSAGPRLLLDRAELEPSPFSGLARLRLHVTAVLLQPFMPETSARILGLLGAPADAPLSQPLEWGTALTAGGVIGKTEILFPRIETDAE